MHPFELKQMIFTMSQQELVTYLMHEQYIPRTFVCNICRTTKKLVSYARSIDKLAWRCYTPTCKEYLKYSSVRKNSFFESFY
jgi:hypothetical protein